MFLWLRRETRLLVRILSSRATVGICAYNEGSNIGDLLQNVLLEQQLSWDSEVIVVCSGCTDNTVKVVQLYAAKDSRVKLQIEKERNGKASAVNRILAQAKGDAIIFISADTQPSRGSFQRLLTRLLEPNVGLVCGNPSPINNSVSLVGRIVNLLWRFHGHVFEELNDAGLAKHASEAFCIRSGIVNQIPAEIVNDDAYIALNVKKKGWLVKFSSESVISICGPKTFDEYFQQRRRVIFGHYQLKRFTGESAQYLLHMLPQHPLRSMRLALWLFTRCDPITLLTFLATEFVVNAVAIFDFRLGKTHFRWAVLPSTKTVFPDSHYD